VPLFCVEFVDVVFVVLVEVFVPLEVEFEVLFFVDVEFVLFVDDELFDEFVELDVVFVVFD
jgi:hypothetical protein